VRGLWNYYQVHAELQTASALSVQLLTLAQQVQETAMLVAAHRALGSTLFFLGDPASAHTHFTQGLALYDAQQHRAFAFLSGEDAGVVCRIHGAWALWCLGYPDQALARSHEAVTLAQQMAHPFGLGYALSATALFHRLRREERCPQERAEAAMRLAKDQGFPFWMALGCLFRGWALIQQGQAQEGLAQFYLGLTTYRATGAETLRPYWLALLAEAHGYIE
jgi:adenylate cyclase